MPLTSQETRTVARVFTGDVIGPRGENLAVGTQIIRAAADVLAAFIENNAIALNNALPEPFKSLATTAQKRHLFGLVAARLAGLT